jgi:pimeloyl-ACP methyl ester carboxylesterase
MIRIPIVRPGGETSHLAVRYDAPPAAAPTVPLCLLYLHGFGSEQSGEKAEFFRRQALADGFTFCSFDFEGHGRSGGSMRDLTLTRNLENLLTVASWLERRGHPQVCLIGSSMGGGTGLWFSALHPERVIAGLHIAPALELERSLLAWAGPEKARRWQETGSVHFANETVSCELGWGLIEDLREHSTEKLMTTYRTPALLLQGRLDASVPWRPVAELVARCPYAQIELHLFGDGDHRLTDRKQRLWGLMHDFLRGRRLLGS